MWGGMGQETFPSLGECGVKSSMRYCIVRFTGSNYSFSGFWHLMRDEYDFCNRSLTLWCMRFISRWGVFFCAGSGMKLWWWGWRSSCSRGLLTWGTKNKPCKILLVFGTWYSIKQKPFMLHFNVLTRNYCGLLGDTINFKLWRFGLLFNTVNETKHKWRLKLLIIYIYSGNILDKGFAIL